MGILLLQSWRWFGPDDKVGLRDARQAGAEVIVTALHHVPTGDIWTVEEIAKRKALIDAGETPGLTWGVVESLPVSEAIKTRTGDWRTHVENYKTSLCNLAEAGISTICYNFMPILDWTRTDLGAPVASGGRAMRFDLVDFAVFDALILKRDGAEADFTPQVMETARERFAAMSADECDALAQNVTAGLPGAAEHWNLDSLRRQLATYQDISADDLRATHAEFMSALAPLAEDLGLQLCCHPDDPPFSLLGLPRIMSTAEDVRSHLAAVNSPAVGLTYCSGSFGARADNDLPAMAREFGPDIHFVHLRNVRRDSDSVPCGFVEDEHLSGQTDMVAVVAALLAEESRRRAEGRADHAIPMRPDHGHDLLDDLTRGAQPGYPAIGRLKGLAELRGVIAALTHPVTTGVA